MFQSVLNYQIPHFFNAFIKLFVHTEPDLLHMLGFGCYLEVESDTESESDCGAISVPRSSPPIVLENTSNVHTAGTKALTERPLSPPAGHSSQHLEANTSHMQAEQVRNLVTVRVILPPATEKGGAAANAFSLSLTGARLPCRHRHRFQREQQGPRGHSHF